ncbi:MAG: hypothetical protein RLZ98_1077 [Pseudomonadota bacterium]|jgi:ribosomal protein L11 methyltransferase
METYKVVADLPSGDSARRLAGGITELVDPRPDGLTVFEAANGWRVEAYFDTFPDTTTLSAAAEVFVPGERVDLRVETVPDENWVEISQAGLPPVFAGRFTVHGSHDRHRVPRGPASILIDAGEAFGTAHHATTFSCLLAIDEVTRRRSAVDEIEWAMDLGCGTGVLAIALARAAPHARILATDIDADSVRVARHNASVNGASRRIAFARLDGPPKTGAPFDLLIANILAGPLIALAPQIARIVAPGGTLILSGILVPQAPAVEARYRSLGFAVKKHRRLAGWSTFTLEQRI